MSSPNLNSNHDVNELWFAKFFIGSMVAITLLTVVLAFLPSSPALRNSPQIKSSGLNLQAISVVV
ncbi:hypothetical protein VB774_20855 [Pseudanabaena galeata UHCC 0370]|jgi:hypothetical protein|uniref:Uncharacterized protein n=1 Tax=Pseudanabaena galeata UHCC 0370 TaxID=3110310 RepID=A0ABU5TP54_9CYAN|nr:MULTISPECIES: hypothetical protein [Pseudanabaena]MEA5480086.1 hypothetical protein [Pseudanabaena galeata UHCC 0370]MEA5487239.1 hypothetical protein [Pseudanabaena sp. CCNP1317]WGS70458.1 hypothetical protein OA858_12015 [Pseudanabaena galeata CCNP1313]